MQATKAPSETCPVWTKISLAIRKGQHLPESAEIRREISTLLEGTHNAGRAKTVHGGIAAVVECLQERDAAVRSRLDRCKDHKLGYTAASAYVVEQVYQKAEQEGKVTMPFRSNLQDQYTQFLSECDRDAYTRSLRQYALDAADHIDTTRFLDPDAQFDTGVKAEVDSVAELTKVLVHAYRSQEETPDSNDEPKEDLRSIAWRSIPSFLHAYASLSMGIHQEVRKAGSLPPSAPVGKNQRPSEEQNPGQYLIARDEAGRKILTVRNQIADRIPQIIQSYGCPAKYAKSASGQTVIAALGEALLREWETKHLPLLFSEDGTFDIAQATDYFSSLRSLRS